jgi:hypothetical protein
VTTSRTRAARCATRRSGPSRRAGRGPPRSRRCSGIPTTGLRSAPRRCCGCVATRTSSRSSRGLRTRRTGRAGRPRPRRSSPPRARRAWRSPRSGSPEWACCPPGSTTPTATPCATPSSLWTTPPRWTARSCIARSTRGAATPRGRCWNSPRTAARRRRRGRTRSTRSRGSPARPRSGRSRTPSRSCGGRPRRSCSGTATRTPSPGSRPASTRRARCARSSCTARCSPRGVPAASAPRAPSLSSTPCAMRRPRSPRTRRRRSLRPIPRRARGRSAPRPPPRGRGGRAAGGDRGRFFELRQPAPGTCGRVERSRTAPVRVRRRGPPLGSVRPLQAARCAASLAGSEDRALDALTSHGVSRQRARGRSEVHDPRCGGLRRSLAAAALLLPGPEALAVCADALYDGDPWAARRVAAALARAKAPGCDPGAPVAQRRRASLESRGKALRGKE